MFTFSDALVFLREGQKVRRDGWNNQQAHISLRHIPDAGGETFVYTDIRKMPDGHRYEHAWLASHLDLLARDWVLVKEQRQ